MKSKLRAGTPIIALTFIGIAVLFIASCTTDEVTIPDLTGPSGARLFLTIDAHPDKVFIRRPTQVLDRSRLTIQLKDQSGAGVPNARVVLRITNSEGAEVAIGSLDRTVATTDAAGFIHVTYTAPSTAQQPVNTTVFVTAILEDPAYPFEVVSQHPLDLELFRAFDCVTGPGAPTINFTFTPSAPNEDEQVCFDAQGTTDNGTIISFSWQFGDGGTASGAFVCHTFRSDGSFPVTLTVVDDDQNCVSLTRLVEVGEGGAPTCDFTISPNPVSTDTLVFFDASGSEDADGTIVSFQWDFGDGSSASGETVTHSYNFIGTFTVTLTVRDNAGNETVCTQTVTVGTGFPSCVFTFTPAAPNTNEVVTFDGSASTDPEGGTLTFAWDFGDGTPGASGPVVAHTFTAEGAFIVTLTVTDPEGNSVSCSQSVTVGTIPPECAPIQISPNPAGIGDTITFDASAITDDGTIVSFAWNFGDGSAIVTETDPVTTHVYNTAGTFNGSVTVTDNDGNTVSCPFSVTISPGVAPTCSASGSPNPADVGQIVNFTGTANDPDGDALTFEWNFGDGGIANTQNTSHQFNTPGNFTVTFTVTDSTGLQCVDTVEMVIGDPEISINDVSQAEGDAGSSVFTFTVTLSAPSQDNVTVNFTTADGSATVADNDYQATAGVVSFAPGDISETISVTVNGDLVAEGNQNFFVNLSNAVNATLQDAQGIGTIIDELSDL